MIWFKRLLIILAWIVGSVIGLALLLVVVVAVAFNRANVTNGEILSSGEPREYLLYVPPSYNPDRPTPLVISIHGFAEWPAHQRDISRWNELADEQGFLVVYPSGTGFPLRWRTTGDAGSSTDPMLEVIFISDLIDRLEAEYNIDPARIYANGLSNGGGMSFVLGCRLSERIAAVGGVAGAYMLPMDECNPARAVPMIAFHGTGDEIVPYNGGPSDAFDVPFPVLPDWIRQRAILNGCSTEAEKILTGDSIQGIAYTGCDENASVVFYTVQGGGHSWPGGEPIPEWIVGITTDKIDATRLMWEFFHRYTLK